MSASATEEGLLSPTAQLCPIVLMGVSACGKSTVGHALAARLQRSFLDADDVHPQANIEKMGRGLPLNDEDRAPWLTELRERLEAEPSLILACSALRARYRRVLDTDLPLHWVHLSITHQQAAVRQQQRQNHFFDPKLLQSQFDTLEPPRNALTLDATLPVPQLIDGIMQHLSNASATDPIDG